MCPAVVAASGLARAFSTGAEGEENKGQKVGGWREGGKLGDSK